MRKVCNKNFQRHLPNAKPPFMSFEWEVNDWTLNYRKLWHWKNIPPRFLEDPRRLWLNQEKHLSGNVNFVAKLLFRPQSCRDIRIAIQDWNHFNVMYATSRFLNQSTSKLISKRIIQRPLRWRLKVAKLSKFIENKCCVVIFSFIYYFLLETLNAYWDLLKKVKSFFFWTNKKKFWVR